MKFFNTFFLISFSFVLLVITSSVALAFDPTSTDYGGLAVRESIGAASSVGNGAVLIVNLLVYLGWAMAIIGVLFVLVVLIFKLIGSEDSDMYKELQGYVTKAILIIIIGILLSSAGFFVTLAETFTGEDVSSV